MSCEDVELFPGGEITCQDIEVFPEGMQLVCCDEFLLSFNTGAEGMDIAIYLSRNDKHPLRVIKLSPEKTFQAVTELHTILYRKS